MDETDDFQASCELYRFAALKGPTQLRSQLTISEDQFRFIAPALWVDPRPALIYRALDEVQKAGLALDDWSRLLDPKKSTEQSVDHLGRLASEWIEDEQSSRARKLVEVLLDLVCFSTTNESEYYRDYLRLREFDSVCRGLRDQQRFFGFRRQNTDFYLRSLEADIRTAENKLLAENRWYLKSPRRFDPKWRAKGVRFSTWLDRYTITLGVGKPKELAALGKSYLHAYGMSSKIHFSPIDHGAQFDKDNVILGLHRVGLLSLAILMRCHDLLGLEARGVNAQLKEVYDDDAVTSELIGALKQDKMKVGDFVWADRYICEIVEMSRSAFDYVAYKVKYLEPAPIATIGEDWFAAGELRLLAERSFMMSALEANSEIGPSWSEKSPAERYEIIRQAVIRLAEELRRKRGPADGTMSGST